MVLCEKVLLSVLNLLLISFAGWFHVKRVTQATESNLSFVLTLLTFVLTYL